MRGSGKRYGLVSALLCLLVGGSLQSNAVVHDSPGVMSPVAPNKMNPSVPAVQAAVPQPIRVIIYFQQATKDSKPLLAAIAEACACQPIFLSAYGADALIYEVPLSQSHTFAVFSKALMSQAGRFGIRLVEQDAVMQHQ